MAGREPAGAATVLDRRTGVAGELVLRRADGGPAGERLEIIANGCFLMDTADGASERLLVDAALRWCAAAEPSVLIGGLGVGFSLAHAAASPTPRRLVVVEREQAVIDWHAGPLRAHSAGALDDPRVEVRRGDLRELLAGSEERFDALCVDIDNGPDWTVSADNAALYTASGLDLLCARLAPGGVLAVWSADLAPGFEAALRARFEEVECLVTPVRGRAARELPPDVVFRARGPLLSGAGSGTSASAGHDGPGRS